MALTQRRRRSSDPGYLKWLRAQRCACGCLQGPPCDAAHLRAGSMAYNKFPAGLGQKPDDRWALPLKHAHHMNQHTMSELVWWAARGVQDPFALCIEHYARYHREGGA